MRCVVAAVWLALLVLAVGALACRQTSDGGPDSPETPTPSATYTATPVSTPTLELKSTHTTVPTATPIPTPEPRLTHTPVQTATLTPDPTQTRTPTLTPIPTATHIPTPTNTPIPTPTPTLEDASAAHLSEIIPWFDNPPDTLHVEARQIISNAWLRDIVVGETVARLPWITDGIVDREVLVLGIMSGVETTSREMTALMLAFPWFVDDVTMEEASAFSLLDEMSKSDFDLVRIVTSYDWFSDGLAANESHALSLLLEIVRSDLGLAKLAAERAWFVDGGTEHGWGSLAVLHGIARQDLDFARMVMNYPWLIDDGPPDQWRTLGLLLDIVRPALTFPTGVPIGGSSFVGDLPAEQSIGLRRIRDIASWDLGLAGLIVSRPWFTKGASADEWDTLGALRGLALLDLELARELVGHPWLIDGGTQHHGQIFSIVLSIGRADLEVAQQVVEYPWFIDGVSEDELQTLFLLDFFAEADVELGRLAATYPWIIDGVTRSEQRTLVVLRAFARADLELARSKANDPWIIDGVPDDEFVRFALGVPDTAVDLTADLTGGLREHLVEALSRLGGTDFDNFQALGTQPWLADGLDDSEAAFVVALNIAARLDPALYQDLLQDHFVQTRTISLPLAGDVNIWVIQNAPFPPDDELLTAIEGTVRIAEKFMGSPFPTTDIVLLIVVWDDDRKYKAGGGAYLGYAMWLERYKGHRVGGVVHETAHYYFSVGPRWFKEGGATFIDFYVNDQNNIQGLAERPIGRHCDHIENLHHLDHVTAGRLDLCHYSMGVNFLLNVFATIGEEAMSSALRELFSSAREYRRSWGLGPEQLLPKKRYITCF